MASNQICILTQSHLCCNPRVLKEAVKLSENGYTVYILNSIFRKQFQEQDAELVKDYPLIHVLHISDLTGGGIRSFTDRIFFKIGGFLNQYLKIENGLALGYGALRYLKKSKSINADLYICHQELATYTGVQLIKAGYKVAFDLEDWYSADLLQGARKKRPVRLLEKAESVALNLGLFCTTTSHALANELARKYGSKKPEVIYNVFPFQIRLHDREKKFSIPLKLFWFSQTIGPGRGIEEFIALLRYYNTKVQLNLLGAVDPDYKTILNALMPPQHDLFFHDIVKEKDLPQKISDFDVGLALELINPQSRNYTITNKFFQYLQAGLPVIATETAGQKEIFNKFKIGFMLPQSPTISDVDGLIKWLNDTAAIQLMREEVKSAALRYSWEMESTKILNLVKNALEPKN